MKLTSLYASVVLAFSLLSSALGQGTPDVDFNDKSYKPGKDDPGNASLPTLFFAGDSISEGYAVSLKTALKGKFNCVFRKDLPSLYPDSAFPGYPGESSGIVKLLNVYFKNPAFHPNVLLLNAGIHDVCKSISLDTYLDNLESIVEIASAQKCQLIWIESSPFAESLAKNGQKGYRNSRLQEYNRAASELMAKHGIHVIPFYKFHEDIVKSAGDIKEIYWDIFHQKPDIQKKQGEFLAAEVLKLTKDGITPTVQAVPGNKAGAITDQGQLVLLPSNSTYIDFWKDNTAKNFSDAKSLQLAAAPHIAKTAFLRFDLTRVPAGRELMSAELVLSKSHEKDPGEIRAGVMKDELDCTTVTAATAPKLDSSKPSVAVNAEKQWIFSGPDFTSRIQTALKDGGVSVTFWIRSSNPLGYAGIVNNKRNGPALTLKFK
ncbi:MAG: GDSL-type esterase/lipase family protein [Victivallales bacterium]